MMDANYKTDYKTDLPWRQYQPSVPAIGSSPAIHAIASDYERIRKHMAVPQGQWANLAVHMNSAASARPGAVPIVQDALDRLDDLEATAYSLQSDGNYALVKAGALEWSTDRASGIDSQRQYWQGVVIEALAIQSLTPRSRSRNAPFISIPL